MRWNIQGQTLVKVAFDWGRSRVKQKDCLDFIAIQKGGDSGLGQSESYKYCKIFFKNYQNSVAIKLPLRLKVEKVWGISGIQLGQIPLEMSVQFQVERADESLDM